MADAVKHKFAERFPTRSAKARATRERMLDAARELFLQQGYAKTTIEGIARRAGVSPQNVYFAFGNKRTVLKEVFDVAGVGDVEPVPVLERPWVQAARDEPDPARQLRIHARAAREIFERAAPLFDVVRSAAAVDPDLAAQWELNKRQRWEAQSYLVELLANKGGLRNGMDLSKATDILVSVMSPDLYLLLVHERGWAPEDWEDWVTTTLETQLLSDQLARGQ